MGIATEQNRPKRVTRVLCAADPRGSQDAIEALPGLAVCGAAYNGVGVAACVASARQAADQVLSGLGLVPGSEA